MSGRVYRARRIVALVVLVAVVFVSLLTSEDMWQPLLVQKPSPIQTATGSTVDLLATIDVKGRAPKTGYERTQFGNGWAVMDGCDTRNIILYRDLKNPVVSEGCKVASGILNDPYTGNMVAFVRGPSTSDDVQIDHVVALSNAWQTGAQQLSQEERERLANDPLELLAVDGSANQEKSDGDAATWLPQNKAFRCQYVARQVAVKAKYRLWVTPAEKEAIVRILSTCPGQPLPTE